MANSVATNLKALRQSRAYSQAELAELAGVQKVTVTRIELGRVQPRPRTIRKLAKALGVNPWELLDSRGSIGDTRRA
jgi:HTH-type transcriptional regulator, competence development regulator